MPDAPTNSKNIWSFDPRMIPGCIQWLDGADMSTLYQDSAGTTPVTSNGQSVNFWRDKSSASNNMTSNTTSPTYTKSLSGVGPAVNFAGGGGLSNTGYPMSSNVSFFAVCAPNGWGAWGTLWGHFRSGNHDYDIQLRQVATDGIVSWHTNNDNTEYLAITPSNASVLYSCTMSNGVNMFVQNFCVASTASVSYVEGSSTIASGTSAPIWMGRSDTSELYNGYISEIIYYNTTLSTTQRQEVEGYLAWKWGFLPYSVPPYTTFSNTGSLQSYVVPSGVTTSYVYMWGAGGGGINGGNEGGAGAYIQGALTTTPGETLSILVGGGGKFGGNGTTNPAPPQGGYGGGGNGNSGGGTYSGGPSANGGNGSAGGGRSAIQRSGTEIVTAGGGGGGAYGRGGCATWQGTAMHGFYNWPSNDGAGGSQTAGGAAGIGGNPTSFGVATAGSQFQGGNGNNYGGGGGGGWYGGGGGSTTGGYGASGGGGSSYTSNLSSASGADASAGATQNAPVQGLPFYVSGVATGSNAAVGGGGGPGLVVISAAPLTNGATGIFLPTSHPFYSARPSLRTFQPTDIDGCVLWLDGGDSSTVSFSSGSNVSQWSDKSGLGNHALASTSPAVSVTPPTYTSTSKGLLFTAANSTGIRGNMTSNYTSNASVFVVANYISNSASPVYGPRLFMLGSNTSSDIFFIGQLNIVSQGIGSLYASTPVVNDYFTTSSGGYSGNYQTADPISYSTTFLYSAISSLNGTTSISVNTYLNGSTSAYSSSTGVPTFTSSYASNYNRYSMGTGLYNASGTNGDSYNGYIYEVVVYSGLLSTSQRQQVEGYLAKKWNLVNSTPAFTNPGSVSGLQLWLDASDSSTVTTSGSNVTNVRDKSPNNLTLSGATGFSYPNNTFNGTYPSFYGSNTANAWNLGSNSISLSQPLTVFFVGMRPPISTNFYDGYIFDGLNSTNRIYQYGDNYTTGALTNTTMIPGRFPNVPLLITTVFNTTSSSQYINGTQVLSNINGGTSNLTSGIRIANSYSSNASWVGHFCEFVVYNSVLSTLQRQQVEYYLANKWGLLTVASFAPCGLPNCALWFDAADTSPTSITTSGTQITVWWDKSRNGTNATPNSNVVTSGTATYNGRNILQTASNADLQFTTAFTNQARAWFAVFRQTTQLSNSGGPIQQYFAIINQTVGSGQDGIAGPTTPTSYSSSTYQMGEGPSAVAAWILTGNTVPNGYNVFGVYTWVNSAASTANNIINVNGTSYALSLCNAVATSYNTGNIKYTINTGWYSNACDIAEIICINGEITSTQRQQVEYYLANKWGISGPSSVSYGPPAVSTAAVTTSVLPSNHPYYVLPPATVLPFLPTQISGCCLWLDGNDPAGTGTQPSAGALATWVDKSGSNNNMTAVGTTPTFSNYPPGAVAFGGAGYYSNANPVLSNYYTAFFVYKQTASVGPLYTTGASSGSNGLFPNEGGTTYFTRGDSTWYTTTSPFTSNVKNLATVSFSSNAVGSNQSLYYNGSNVVTTTQSNTITYTNLLIGSRQSGGTEYLTGYIYEVLAYAGTLTMNQQQRVEGYLAQKWKL